MCVYACKCMQQRKRTPLLAARLVVLDILVQLFSTPARGTLMTERTQRWKELIQLPEERRTRRQVRELQQLSDWMLRSRPPDPSDDPILTELQRLRTQLTEDQ